jgi:glyoxylase-like metal-dependent hydrolase (beta-lactamase superfamily II)
VTWHPPEARGFAAMNTYVLREGGHALIIDTGVSAHTEALLEQLASVLDADTELAVLHTRIGEYTTISNTVPIAERFAVTTIHSEQADSPRWVDFRQGHGRDVGELDALAGARIELFVVPDTIAVDPARTRVLDVFHSTLRLLPTSWLYDHATRTLFTSDVFSHGLRRSEAGPWVLTDADDDTTLEGMRRHLLATRYWWLAGAHLEAIRRSLGETFARYDVERIAPDFGCVLSGRELVRRHVGMLDDILEQAQQMAPAPMARAGANP